MNETIDLMDGALHVYRRENSGKWQCSTCLNGHNYRQSTKTDNLSLAQDFAKNWYLGLLGQSNAGLLEEAKKGKKFEEAARQLLTELPMLTAGERSERYFNDQKKRLESVILPFLGKRYLSEAPASITEYRIHRAETCKTKKPPLSQHDAPGDRADPPGLQMRPAAQMDRSSAGLFRPLQSVGKSRPARVVLPTKRMSRLSKPRLRCVHKSGSVTREQTKIQRPRGTPRASNHP